MPKSFRGRSSKSAMKSIRNWIAVACSCMAVLFLCRSGTPASPTKEQIAQAIRQLGDNDFFTREKASEFLWTAGSAAEEALREAATSNDPEVKRRAGDILEKFKFGIYPTTPTKIVDQIQQYRSGDNVKQRTAIQELFKLGSPGYRALVKLAGAEENVNVRRNLFQQVAQQARQDAASLIIQGNFDQTEELLEIAVAADTEPVVRDYAAFLMLRGRLDRKMAQYRARVEHGDRNAAEVATYLYRANGDLKNALWAAEKSGKDQLERAILLERSDWQSLYRKDMAKPWAGIKHDIEALGFRAAYQRLTGHPKEMAETMTAIQEFGTGRPDESTETWFSAEALLLNGKVREGIDLLIAGKNIGAAFDLLCAQHRYREALALADQPAAAGVKNHTQLEARRARILYILGEKDRAQQLFVRLAGEINSAANPAEYRSTVSIEYRLGLKKQAREHCAMLLEKFKSAHDPGWILESVFPGNGELAGSWLRYRREKFPKEDFSLTLKQVSDLLDGKTDVPDFVELIKDAERQKVGLHVLGETCRLAGRDDLAREYFEKDAKQTSKASALIHLGDFLADRKLWKEAAENYHKAWQREELSKESGGLYLWGWALTHSGQEELGRKQMELAHILPLGNDEARDRLAQALEKHDLSEAAAREYDTIIRTGAFESASYNNALRHIAYDAVAKKNYFKAAECFERSLLDCLYKSTSFARTEAYLNVPSWVHYYSARGLLARGKVDEALKEAEICLTALPGDVDIPIDLVPDLEKRGRKEEAAKLYSRAAAVYEELCREYPKSAWAHNTLAWLQARCRRDLDAALEHSQFAIQLEPENAGYLDTLAEVHFQRGSQDKAIESMKKCVAMEPKNDYFRKQLKRIEAGDRSAELPPSS